LRRVRHSTIASMREEANKYYVALWQAGQSIVSGLNTGDMHSQATHADELAKLEGWTEVIGIGYSEKQRRDLIYRHLAKLTECLRKVTSADPTMAKQLVDLMHARVHAGEHRYVSAASLKEKREQQLCTAVTDSIAEFVSGLHAAGGSGRYADKITKSMQAHSCPLSGAHPLPATASNCLQVQTTIVPVVVMARVEDLRNITEERRAQLIDYFDKNNLPRVIAETHFVISSDLQHDNAIIQKIFDDLIFPYIKEHAPGVTVVHVRSDGCKVRSSLCRCVRACDASRLKDVFAGMRAAAGPIQVRGQLLLGVAAVQGGLGPVRELVFLRVVPRQVLLRSRGRHAQKCSQEARAPLARPDVQGLGGRVQVGGHFERLEPAVAGA